MPSPPLGFSLSLERRARWQTDSQRLSDPLWTVRRLGSRNIGETADIYAHRQAGKVAGASGAWLWLDRFWSMVTGTLVVGAKHLWERDQHLSAAAARIAGAQESRGGALFVLGEAGLGKTSLLDEICRQADEDLLITRARCDPMETSVALGMLYEVVNGLGGGAGVWTGAAEGTDARAATLYRALRWLEQVAPSPLLITLDDLQWADPDSLVLLGFLCRRLARMPVAVIGSLRPWPPAAAELAWSLVHRGDAAVEHLLPLTREAAAGVLAERLGGPVPADVTGRAWELTGGNPLLLGLAAGALASEGALSTETEALTFSADERSLVLTSFAGLSPAGTRWAQAAAVLGIEFRPELVSEVAGLDAEAAALAADAVWRSGLARAGRSGAAEFVHPLFRQLLYEDVAAPVRERLHARAFTALTARGMDDIAAEHAMRANLAGNAAAIRVLTETGRRARRAGAPATAATRLEAAVGLSGDSPAPSLLAELGGALLEAGHAAEAASTIEQVLETDLPLAQRVEALTVLARAQFAIGDFHGAGAAMQSAAVLAERKCPEAVVVPLCVYADTVLMTAGPASALAVAARARELAQGASEDLQAQANAKWGMLAFFCGDPSGLLTTEAEGRRLLGASAAEVAADVRSGMTGVLLPGACAAAAAQHYPEAEAAFRAGIHEAERVGAVTAAAALRISYGLLMLLRSRLRDSLAVADRLLDVADLVPLAEPLARTLRSYAFLELGQEEQSATEWERARSAATAFGIWLSLLWLDHVQGLRLVRHGRFTDASNVYAELEERYGDLSIGEPCIIPYARHAVVAHTGAGRMRDAERVVDWLDERASCLPCRWPAAAAAGGRALLALQRGDRAAADKAYRRAVEHLDGASLPLEQAELLIEHGSLLRHDGRSREARESLKGAVQLAESAGAVWLARRAGEELAVAGGRRRIRRGAQELTPQEQRIARLAATGASDKDISAHLGVSVRTVRTHLEHIYTKLGIHSRRELMAMGERLEALLGRER